jgi:fatty acid CoA ligase FadD9
MPRVPVSASKQHWSPIRICSNDSARRPTGTWRSSPPTSANRDGVSTTPPGRLAESVDLIVHPAAHVNHVLPYDQLFAANVAGTAELIRLALTTKLKTVHYISTMGVTAVADHIVGEDADIRLDVPAVSLSDGYANGYGVSKWASEVLLREAHDLCSLPVAVFRPGMILADSRYDGQLNVPDIFTRLLYSVIATGVAPASFYVGGARAHYEGLPVDFLAGAIAEVGTLGGDAFQTYNTTNPHDDGVSLDTFVDWLTDSGFPVRRIDDHTEWLSRFETAMQALPERARQLSVLTVLDVYRHPAAAVPGSPVPAARFRAAVESAGQEIPSISRELIAKYVDDMRLLGML